MHVPYDGRSSAQVKPVLQVPVDHRECDEVTVPVLRVTIVQDQAVSVHGLKHYLYLCVGQHRTAQACELDVGATIEGGHVNCDT